MDYGLHAALTTALTIHESLARHSGRTRQIIDATPEGGLLIVGARADYALWLQQEARRRGKTITVFFTRSIHEAGNRVGRFRANNPDAEIRLDHTFIETLYRDAIEHTLAGIGWLDRSFKPGERIHAVAEWISPEAIIPGDRHGR